MEFPVHLVWIPVHSVAPSARDKPVGVPTCITMQGYTPLTQVPDPGILGPPGGDISEVEKLIGAVRLHLTPHAIESNGG